MPPVMEERKPINRVLSENPELKGLEASKLVFTDITYGVRDRVCGLFAMVDLQNKS